MTLRRRCSAAASTLALLGWAFPSRADQTCVTHPYAGATGELAGIVQQTRQVVAGYPSLATALAKVAPEFCLDDALLAEQAYFVPAINRIVIRAGLHPSFQLAVLIHEIRHLEQYANGICPTVNLRLVDYERVRLALEADASAIGLYVAWELRLAGNAGPWDALKAWPTHDDLALAFEVEMTASADPIKAVAATFSAWYDDLERREMYAIVACSNYLDQMDGDKLLRSPEKVPDTFAKDLCRMPDGRPYACFLRP